MKHKKLLALATSLALAFTMMFTTTVSFADDPIQLTNENCTVTLSKTTMPVQLGYDDNWETTFKNQRPTIESVCYVDASGSTELIKGTDFEVAWPENSADKGTYEVYILGKGGYTGSVAMPYTIEPLEFTDTEWDDSKECEYDVYDYTVYRYNGKKQTAKNFVVEAGIKEDESRNWYELKEGRDYNATGAISGNVAKDIGWHDLALPVEGINNFTGTANLTGSFTIYPARTKINSAKSTKKGQITVKWAKIANCDGYCVSYFKGSWGNGCKKVFVNGKNKTSTTLKKLKSKKKYIITVEAYKKVHGSKVYYEPWYESGKNIKKVIVK